ncbi:MAG TPA: FkbM family methyltransferase [Stellaceae bacterium]|nr:FkbM family methyltransferase [Stellaceae bacterium]
MSLVTSIKRKGAKFVETHPLSWYFAWILVHKLHFLLPHDQSYMAVRYFPDTDGTLLLDVGANDGISVLSFHKINPTLRFISLEPNSIHKKSLEKLRGKIKEFEYRLIGAGDSPSEIDLFTPICFGVTLHTATSSDRDRLLSWVEAQYGKFARKHTSILHCKACLATVDSLSVDPKIIKIDAEGFDYNVLLGSQKTIARNRPFIITEVSHYKDSEEFIFLMNEIKYSIYGFDIGNNKFYVPDVYEDKNIPGHRNMFLIPNEYVDRIPI